MNFNVTYFYESILYGLHYLPNTLRLVFIPLLAGFILGTIIALLRVYQVPLLGHLLAAGITIYQGIPTVVALMIYNLLFLLKFNDLTAILHIPQTISQVDHIWVGIFTLTLGAICSLSETIRGALLSIDLGQSEAGFSVGLTRSQTIRRIILPQMIPVAIPMLVNNVVGLIKASSIVTTIGILEIMSGAIIPSSRSYAFFEGYLAAALIYWCLTVLIEQLAGALSRYTGRFRRNSYD